MVAGLHQVHCRHRQDSAAWKTRQRSPPLDYKGRLTYWYTGPNDASPDIDKKIDADFWAAWKATYPNIATDYQNIDYNELLDKLRTTLLGNAGPMVVRLQIVRRRGICRERLLPRTEAGGHRLRHQRIFGPAP